MVKWNLKIVFLTCVLVLGVMVSLLLYENNHRPKVLLVDPVISGQKLFKYSAQPSFLINFSKPPNTPSNALYILPKITKAQVLYHTNPADVPVRINQHSDTYELTVGSTGKGVPGGYSLLVDIQTPTGNKQLMQKFAWGVLAINPTKSVYSPGETAEIDMAALDGDGKTLCDAPLVLTITAPDGTSSKPTIARSGICNGDSYVSKPDYTAKYKVSRAGTYQMSLRLAASQYMQTDTFEVKTEAAFVIERTGPTRIYPPATYVMVLKVHTNQDFSGLVSDSLPAYFRVMKANNTRIETVAGRQIVEWRVSWTKGSDYTLAYGFLGPGVSPSFYYLGPLKIGTGMNAYQESRQWQIAGDAALVTSVCNSTSSCTTTNGINTSHTIMVFAEASNATLDFACSTPTLASGNITDSGSNSYTLDKSATFNASHSIGTHTSNHCYAFGVWSARTDTALTSSNTVTFTNTATKEFIYVYDINGLTSYPSIAVSGNSNNQAPGTSVSTGTSGSTSIANELDIAAFDIAPTNAPTFTAPTGYTQPDSGVEFTYKNASTAGSHTVSTTGSYSIAPTGTNMGGLIAVYQVCAAPTTDQLLRGGRLLVRRLQAISVLGFIVSCQSCDII